MFLKDSAGDDIYYNLKDKTFLKSEILDIVIDFFRKNKTRVVNIRELTKYVKTCLGVKQLNNIRFFELVKCENNVYVYLDNVIKQYNKYSEKKLSAEDFSFTLKPPKKTEIVIQPRTVKESEEKTEYFYCSKSVKFPLKDVIQAIYDYYIVNVYTVCTVDEISDYLSRRFSVDRFNKQNLKELLTSNINVPLDIVQDLYLKYNFNLSVERLYDYGLINFLFIDNRLLTEKIISVLGKDFFIYSFQHGTNNFRSFINAVNSFFQAEVADCSVSGRKNKKPTDIKNAKLIIELLSAYTDEEWCEILKDGNKAEKTVTQYIESKKLEEDKILLKKYILELMPFVHQDNKKGRVEYLFHYNISVNLLKQKLYLLEDLTDISKKTAAACYEFKAAFINRLKRMSFSIPENLNEKFKRLIQMANKDYKPNSNWKGWIKIIEERAKGATLEQAGKCLGVTRERTRQLEKRYMSAFSKFIDGNLSNIRAFVDNPMFITADDIKRLFTFKPKVFQYLLSITDVDGLEYIEEIEKFYFTDGYDWYNELIKFSDNMPEQLSMAEMKEHIYKVLEIFEKKGISLSFDDCKKIISQSYKQLGQMYSKSRMTLTQRFGLILRDYFPKGANIYDEGFLAKFRKIYTKLYNKDDKIKSDHAISCIIAKIGMLVDRGKYVFNDRYFMSEKLADEIYRFIAFGDRKIYLTNNLFAIFKDKLLKEGINNKYFLQGALRQRIGDKLYFRRDYVSIDKEATSIYGEIYKVVKEADGIITYKDLQKEFVGVPWNVLLYALDQDGILNYRSKYLYIGQCDLTEEEKLSLKTLLTDMLADGGIYHIDTVYERAADLYAEIFQKTFVEDSYSLFSLLEYYFNDSFEFKRPYIAPEGVAIETQYKRILDYVGSFDELPLDSLLNYIYENKLNVTSIIGLIDSFENYIFKDNYNIICIDKSKINSENVSELEEIISEKLDGKEFLFAEELQSQTSLPAGVEWTPWLIYSAVNKFGTKIKAIASDNKFKIKNNFYARPLLIKKDLEIDNIIDFNKYLRKKLKLSDIEFETYITQNGLK